MAVNLYPLIQLHYLDQQIGSLQQSISKMPARMQEVDKKLDRFQKNVQERQQLIAENQKKRKELESDLALIETKRNRYKEQLDTVKTNKEYTALQHEIEGVNLAIRQIEDQILTRMEEAEALKLHLEEAQKAKDREENTLLEEKKVIQAEADRLQQQMDGLKAKRQEWVSQIPQPTIAMYDRTAKHRRGIAMAEAKDEICLECQMRIRPQLFQEIKRNDSIITCESCSRILFFKVPESASAEEIQSTNP
jgi:uncharacterized protein